MKRNVIYWKTKDQHRKTELGITSESVNGESDFYGEYVRLIPYVEEGLIVIRMKDE